LFSEIPHQKPNTFRSSSQNHKNHPSLEKYTPGINSTIDLSVQDLSYTDTSIHRFFDTIFFERVEGEKRRGTKLTGGLGADVSEEGGDLHHAHLLAAGGAEAAGLEERGGGDEGLVVPETGGVGENKIVAIGEERLELLGLEVVADCLVAAEPATAALPSLVAHILILPRRRRRSQQQEQQCRPQGLPHRGLSSGLSLSLQARVVNQVSTAKGSGEAPMVQAYDDGTAGATSGEEKEVGGRRRGPDGHRGELLLGFFAFFLNFEICIVVRFYKSSCYSILKQIHLLSYFIIAVHFLFTFNCSSYLKYLFKYVILFIMFKFYLVIK
jgi:hypothetical protein